MYHVHRKPVGGTVHRVATFSTHARAAAYIARQRRTDGAAFIIEETR